MLLDLLFAFWVLYTVAIPMWGWFVAPTVEERAIYRDRFYAGLFGTAALLTVFFLAPVVFDLLVRGPLW